MSEPRQIDEETRVVRSDAVLQVSLGKEKFAVMKIKGAHYYGFEGPASQIWELLRTETALGAICDILIAEYEVPRSHCLRDTSRFIQSLISEDLVTIVAP